MTVVNSYAELMALNPQEFVVAAYRLVLGRAPDEAGSTYYLARLRAGYSRLSVLHQLGKGAEPASWEGLPALRTAVRRYRIGRLPFIGWLFRKLWRVEGETVSERLQRAMISDLAETRSGIAALGNELELIRGDIARVSASQTVLRNAAAAAVAPSSTSALSATGPQGRRRNLVAEKLSPSAREIFDQLIAG